MISNLEYYRAFYYVAIYGSFSSAANSLHLTQSAVSQSVKKLELELNTTLFFRRPHIVTLTVSGSILYEHIQKAFSTIQLGEQSLLNHESFQRKQLLLGATETSVRYFLPKLLHCFQKHYPEISITMNGSHTQELIQLLLDKKLELAFLILSEELKHSPLLSGLSLHKYCSIQDILVVSQSFGLDSAKTYTLEELMSFPFISVTVENSVRHLFDTWFIQEDLIFTPAYTVRSMSLVLSLVENNLGIGILPKEFALEGIKQGTLMELKTTTLPKPRTLFLAYSSTAILSANAKAFLALLEKNG